MSGRIYDPREGIPICECGEEALRSEETNFNGSYCPHCEEWGQIKEFKTNHPLWISWQKSMQDKQGKLVSIDVHGFSNFKKKWMKKHGNFKL